MNLVSRSAFHHVPGIGQLAVLAVLILCAAVLLACAALGWLDAASTAPDSPMLAPFRWSLLPSNVA